MKKRIKKIILGLPGIKRLVNKWKVVKTDIKRLRKVNTQKKHQLEALENKLETLSQATQKSQIMSLKNRNQFIRYERDVEQIYQEAMLKGTSGEVVFKRGEENRILNQLRPLVSIIVLNRNGMDNLKVLLPSLKKAEFYSNFELIFIDNNSSDDSISYLQEWQAEFKIKIIQNKENMSFSSANNLGVKQSEGEYLLFLNNDTEVTDGWLDELLVTACKDDSIGAVGAKLIYPQIPKDTINAGKSYTIQHRGIGFKDSFREAAYFTQPYNLGNGDFDLTDCGGPIEKACVTAATLLVSRVAFDHIGGFDERYIYGYEDVDLCLQLYNAGYKNYLCPTSLVYHYEFGTQNKDNSQEIRKRRLKNMSVFKGKWQTYLQRKMFSDKVNGTSIFTEEPLMIGIVVTESKPDTTAGDFFTAMELAMSFEKCGYKVKYLSRRGPADWYDVGIEVDIIISLLDAYDISKIKNVKNNVLRIAWARNWFERWCDQEYFNDYDMVFASSKIACEYITKNSKLQAQLLPIATNYERFRGAKENVLNEDERGLYTSDYSFTGSYWNVKREIMDYLKPEKHSYQFKVFGANWEKSEELAAYAQGFITYSDIPKVYQNTKIVIDDANHVTKEYGAVNSRVFDALAAGVLVLTNGVSGAEETFKGVLPSFNTPKELDELLVYYMENEEERIKLICKLQKMVREEHTYDKRVESLKEFWQLDSAIAINPKGIDIYGAMPDTDTKKFWGDYHYAEAMKKEFEKKGYQVCVKPYQKWFDYTNNKYAIVLRGIRPYYPKVEISQELIMWNISHPEEILLEEYNMYDRVYIASKKLADRLAKEIDVPVKTLLQCTDFGEIDYKRHSEKLYDILFIGNSRKIFRPIIKDLVPTPYKVTIYGRDWEGFPEVYKYVEAQYLDNAEIGQAYQDAKIVLNDHWDDMREEGLISNRIFDVLGAGAFVISDFMPELEEIFDGCLETYKSKEELQEKVKYYMEHPDERELMAKRGQKEVLENHTFAERVLTIVRDMER